MSTCIIVLGCYRSGTSIAAGVLHHLGIFVGDSFDFKNENNPTGYWEDLEFKSLHERIINRKILKLKGELQLLFDDQEYMSLVKKRSEHDIWGLKDPKLSHLFPFFVKCLDSLGMSHKVINCTRSVESISDSLSRATNTPDTIWSSAIASYIKIKEENLKSYQGNVLDLRFEELQNPEHYVNKIAAFVGLEPNQKAIDLIRR